MSRPKTGSVTDAVGENGTPFTYSRIVSQEPATAPAMPSATRTENSATTQVPIGTMSGMSSDSNTNVGPDAVRGPVRPGAAQARVVLGAALGIGEPVRPRLEQPGPRRVRGRHEAAGEPAALPSSTTSAIARPATNSPTCAPRRVDRTLTKPTDWYQIDVGPEVDADADQQDDEQDDDADRGRGRARRKMLPMEGGRAPSSGPPTGAPDPSAAGSRPSRGCPTCAAAGRRAASAAGSGWARRRRGASPSASSRAVVLVAGPSASAASSSSADRARRLRARARRAALGLGTPPFQLPHELVEQVAHRTAFWGSRRQQAGPLGRSSVARIRESDPAGAGLRAVECLDRAAEARQDLLRELVRAGAWRRAPARSGTRSGSPAGSATGRVSSSGGTTGVRRIASRPSSSRISPDSDPANAGPRRSERWLGGRAGGRTDVAERDDALVVGHPQDGEPPVVRAVDGLRHARPGAGGRRCGPPARAGTRDRDAGRRSGTRPRIPAAAGSGGRRRRAARPGPAPRRRSQAQRGGAAAGAGGRARGVDGRRAATGDRPRPGPPGRRRRRSSSGSASPSVARSIPSSSTTSVLLAMLSASRSARSASNWSRSISRRTASSGGASDSASSGAAQLDRLLAGDERQEPAARAGSTSPRARRIASVSSVVTPLMSARVRARSTASRRRTGRCRGRRRGGAPSTTGSAVPCRSSGRPWAQCYLTDSGPRYPFVLTASWTRRASLPLDRRGRLATRCRTRRG